MDAWLVKRIFSLILTYYLIKTKNRNKKISTIAFSTGTISAKKADFLKKYAAISKMMEVLEKKGLFSETKYVCALTYQIASF